VDRKTLRGAGTVGGIALHLMACLDHGSDVVCAQIAVAGKTNEVNMFASQLDHITDLNSAVITAAALHARRENTTYPHQCLLRQFTRISLAGISVIARGWPVGMPGRRVCVQRSVSLGWRGDA
jgi:uncharacterized protein YsxB (DUF464 family)